MELYFYMGIKVDIGPVFSTEHFSARISPEYYPYIFSPLCYRGFSLNEKDVVLVTHIIERKKSGTKFLTEMKQLLENSILTGSKKYSDLNTLFLISPLLDLRFKKRIEEKGLTHIPWNELGVLNTEVEILNRRYHTKYPEVENLKVFCWAQKIQ